MPPFRTSPPTLALTVLFVRPGESSVGDSTCNVVS